jgi:hypothetical protein
MIDIIISLLILHIIADFVFQIPSKFRYLKRKYVSWIAIHALIWSVAISLGLMWFNIFYLWKFVFLLTTHSLADYYRCKTPHNSLKWSSIFADQLIHIFTLLIVCF